MQLEGYTDEDCYVQVPKSISHYVPRRIMGTGSTCVVVEAEDRVSGRLHAIKIMPKENLEQRKIMKRIRMEMDVMQKLTHKNIVECSDVLEDDTYIYIVMEHCAGKDLLEWILEGKIQDDDMLKSIFSQILSAVCYLHSIGIAHGDIKAENVIMTESGVPKLTDFGYVHTQRWAGEDEKSGTIYYAAPELLTSGIFDTQKADVWALGILLFAMKTGQFPYAEGDSRFTAKQIAGMKFKWPMNIDCDTEDFVKRMCQKRPTSRPAVAELLTDPYLPQRKFSNNSACNVWVAQTN